jgi:hypothetical protein
MELAVESLAAQERVDRVDPVRDDERRTGRLFRQEVAQRAVERAGEDDAPAVARDQREGPVDRAHGVGVAACQADPRLIGRHVVDAIAGRIGEVDHALDVLVVHGSVPPVAPASYSGACVRSARDNGS